MFLSPLRVFRPLEEPKGLSLLEKLRQAQNTHAIRKAVCPPVTNGWTMQILNTWGGPPLPQLSSLRLEEPIMTLGGSGKPLKGPINWCRCTYAFASSSTTKPLRENEIISKRSCQLNTGPLTSTWYQGLDDLILGRSFCRNWGIWDFPMKISPFWQTINAVVYNAYQFKQRIIHSATLEFHCETGLCICYSVKI